MRKEIIYPGHLKQPCAIEYEIKKVIVDGANHYKIILYDLYIDYPKINDMDIDDVCEGIMNRLLDNEFFGVQLNLIKFYYNWENNGESVESEIGYTFEPMLNIQNLCMYKGNYISLFRKLKGYFILFFGGTLTYENNEYLSSNILAGTGKIRVIKKILPFVIRQDKQND